MSYIKRIIFQGFKSFNQKTVIDTPNCLVCITGPNGSGKSNVFDGISFVLGELSSKDLRTDNLSNLIYNGGAKGRKAVTAIVSLVFENKEKELSIDTEEVTVSRQVTRKGQGIYRINGQLVTRTRIMSLMREIGLHPDGYSIIKQGQVQRFVDMSEADRLKIIEDASGITNYEEKKHKTNLELNKTEKKLNEVRIILNEKTKRLKEIEDEKKNAEKFEELNLRLKTLKASFLNKEISDKKSLFGEKKKNEELLKKRLIETRKDIIESEELLKKHKNEINELDEKIQKSGGVNKQNLEKKINQLQIEKTEIRSKTFSNKKEVNKLQEKNEENQKKINLNTQDLTVNKREFKKTEKEQEKQGKVLESFEKEKQEFENARKKIFELKLELNNLNSSIMKKENETSGLNLTELKNKKNQNEKEIENNKNFLQSQKKLLNELLDKDSEISNKISGIETNKLRLVKKKTELENEKRNFENSLSYSVRKLLENKEKFPGIIGTVNQLYTTKKDYATALSVLLGNKKSLIITENDETIKNCLKFLKDNKIGKASFLNLSNLEKKDYKLFETKKEGVIDLSFKLIEFNLRFEKLFSHLLKNSLIIKDFETAKKVGIGNQVMVSLNGDYFGFDKTITGGFLRKKNQIINPEKEIEEVEIELNNFSQKLNEFLSEKNDLEKKIWDNRDEISKKEARYDFLKNEIIEINQKLEKVEKNLGNNDIQKLENQKKQLEKEIEEVEKFLNSFKEDENLTKSFEKIRILKLKESEIINRINSIIKPKLEELRKEIIDNDAEVLKLRTDEKSFLKRLREVEKELIEKTKIYNSIDKEFEKLFVRKNRLNILITREDNKLNEKNKKYENVNFQITNIQVVLAKEEQELIDLEKKMEGFLEIEVIRLVNLDERRQEINDLDYKIKNFGAVNQKALEMYEDIKKKYDEINEKYLLIEREKDDVLLLIDEIDKKKTKAFMKSFNDISKKFEELFKGLTSGEAYLELTDEENPLEGGLDVRVRTREEKSFTHLRSLSGGEKTITAIAFIMGLQEHTPTPFYIMDEIDAALDKENSEKLGKLLKEQSVNAQFIVVSHNDLVLSQANYLYGVTMNKLGESKLVGIKL